MQSFVRRDGRWDEIPISIILILSLHLSVWPLKRTNLSKEIIQLLFSLFQPNAHIVELIHALKWLPRRSPHSHRNDQYCQAMPWPFLCLSWIATPLSHMPLGSILCRPDRRRSWNYIYIFVCKELLGLLKLHQLCLYFLKLSFRFLLDCYQYCAADGSENAVALSS